MNIKHILLGTAAGLMVATGAQAADLPGEAVPAAVDYVKVCDAFGAGFFYIPGSETCLDISGRVRANVTFSTKDPGADSVGFSADGRVDFDARTASEYGQLRSFFRIKSTSTAGTAIDKAYIQLGYFTVGYAADFFDGFGGLYGVSDRNDFGSTNLQASLQINDIAGGLYAGIQVLGPDDAISGTFGGAGDANLEVQGIVGIASQPWGSAAFALAYLEETDEIQAKLGAEFIVSDPLKVSATVSYESEPTDDIFAGVGVSYDVSDSLTAYANVGFDWVDVGNDKWGTTVGVDYTVTPGLVLTTEVTYDDDGTDGTFGGIVRLNRTW